MYSLNKIIGYLISPAGFSIVLVAAAVLARVLGRRRLAGWAAVLALANFWIWSTPWMTQWMGVALEAEFLVDGRVPSIESLPQADVIKLHGGGMGSNTNVSSYAEMWTSADRVWHAARIWKAGKAPSISVTCNADIELLTDLGVPRAAIDNASTARNTEEEARAVSGFKFQVSGGGPETCNMKLETTRPKVLVVTSAWHMKRTMLMYQKYASNVEAIPAPCDFETTIRMKDMGGCGSLMPDLVTFVGNSIAFHEWLGYFGYKWFR